MSSLLILVDPEESTRELHAHTCVCVHIMHNNLWSSLDQSACMRHPSETLSTNEDEDYGRHHGGIAARLFWRYSPFCGAVGRNLVIYVEGVRLQLLRSMPKIADGDSMKWRCDDHSPLKPLVKVCPAHAKESAAPAMPPRRHLLYPPERCYLHLPGASPHF